MLRIFNLGSGYQKENQGRGRRQMGWWMSEASLKCEQKIGD